MINFQDVQFKIKEIKFHIELLDVIVQNSTTLTHQESTEEEASYILSAILNSFFSVTELLGGWDNNEVKIFKDEHPVIYANSNRGGLRNTTVHVSHVKINHVGYIPSSNFNFRHTPKLILEKELKENKDVVTFNFTPDFYIEIEGKLVNIIDFCTQHLYKIERLAKEIQNHSNQR